MERRAIMSAGDFEEMAKLTPLQVAEGLISGAIDCSSFIDSVTIHDTPFLDRYSKASKFEEAENEPAIEFFIYGNVHWMAFGGSAIKPVKFMSDELGKMNGADMVKRLYKEYETLIEDIKKGRALIG